MKILKKPKGEVEIFASFGLISWGMGEEGRKFVKWGEEKWVPADPNEKEVNEKEEKQ